MQGSVDLSSRVELSEDARFRAMCGEGVVLNQALAEVLVVSPVGLRVLELMRDDGSIAAILTRLHDEYEVDAATLERDVLAFVREMVDAGTLRLGAGASAP
jgi:hypothetical protein